MRVCVRNNLFFSLLCLALFLFFRFFVPNLSYYQSKIVWCVHRDTHTYTRAHTERDTHTHTHTQRHTHTYTHARAHKERHTYIHTHILSQTEVQRTHTYTRTYTLFQIVVHHSHIYSTQSPTESPTQSQSVSPTELVRQCGFNHSYNYL